MFLFDTHAHYYDKRFASDSGEGADADTLLPFLFTEGGGEICNIVNVATRPENFSAVLRQAALYPGMFAALGIHPEDCAELPDAEEALRTLSVALGMDTPNPTAFRKKQKIVAIGEIGLDYAPRHPVDKALQSEYFERQLHLAETCGLPVIVHDRDAHGDCFEAILRHPNVGGVFHCYSGSAQMAKELCRRGWYIAFGGVVTYDNAAKVREAARTVPAEYLLLETDCPYLAPAPHRGERNHSGLLPFVAYELAALRGVTPESLALQCAENAAKLFNLHRNGEIFVQ